MKELESKQTVKCPCCGREVSERKENCALCNVCDIIINLDVLCPDCGAYTYEANDPSNDPSMSLSCCYSHKVIEDQHMTRKENIDIFGEEYTNCEAIHTDYTKKSLELYISLAAYDIRTTEFDKAYGRLKAMQRKELECSESECDSCPIVKALIAKDIIGTDITHGQYPTCSDFIEFMSERSER